MKVVPNFPPIYPYNTCNLQELDYNDALNETKVEGLSEESSSNHSIHAYQSCINHDDLTRCWHTYIPESAKNRKESVPIVLDLHGFTSCGSFSFGYTGWAAVAEKEGFVIIWPQGNMDASVTNSTCFNAGVCCCYSKSYGDPLSQRVDIDDSGFLKQAISNTVNSAINDDNVTIDTTRIYFVGHSNGCMMSQTMAAHSSDLVAAVCCHAGILVTDIPSDYQPTPIQTVHGDLDFIIPFNFTLQNDWFLPSIKNAVESFEFWGATNGCVNKSTTVDNSNSYATHSFSQCNNGAKVQLLQIFNSTHMPYLGFNDSDEGGLPYEQITKVDTTRLSWDFCSAYRSESSPTLPEPVPFVSPNTFYDPTNDDMPTMQPSSDGLSLSANLMPAAVALLYFMFWR